MTLNSGLQIAAYCVLIALALLPRLRALRDRYGMPARAHGDRAESRRSIR